MSVSWQRLGIATRLSVITVVVLLMAGLALFAITVRQIADTTARELTIHLNARLAWTSSVCRDPAIVGDFATIEQALAEQSKLEDALRVSFKGNKGEPLTNSGSPVAVLAPDWFNAWLDLPVFEKNKEILVGGRKYGEVSIALSPNRAINAAWGHLLTISFAALIALIFVVAAILISLRRGLKPLEDLASTAIAFGEGDRSRRMNVQGVPELQTVMVAFNHMAEEISTLVKELTEQAEELKLAKDTADASNLAKSRFLATMSHEIRTPMNGILGMAQLLLMSDITEHERDEYARTILNSGKTLLSLLNDILDLSKVEAGKLELAMGVFSPQQLAEEMASLFHGPAVAKGIVLETRWHGAPDQRYIGDSIRIRQMLSNLLNNAIKFTAVGSVSLDIVATGSKDSCTTLECKVSDTGIGIPKNKLEGLFQPFTQVDSSTTREYGGTGLGLSIVKTLAVLMQGEVGVDSEPGKGSLFRFTVLVDEIVPDAEARSEARVDPERRTAVLSSEYEVLVAEDNLTNRKVIEGLLRKLGYRMALYENGELLLAALDQVRTPAIVLMDVQMPVMDGLTATRRIRELEKARGLARLPIIALTAGAFDEDRQHCLEAGMDDFLTKPVNIAMLQSTLEKWIRDNG